MSGGRGEGGTAMGVTKGAPSARLLLGSSGGTLGATRVLAERRRTPSRRAASVDGRSASAVLAQTREAVVHSSST